MLKEIIENKRKEVELSKKIMPLDSFRSKIKPSERDFKAAISKNKLNLIAEFKKSSPSKNIAKKDFDMGEIIALYNKYADAISVLTDKKYFNGSLEDLRKASAMTKLPLLRKDFIIDEYQIYEARRNNADAVLLIVSILSNDEIKKFIAVAKKYRMACIVEVHAEEELGRALNCGAEIIGINNRNLKTLEIDDSTTLNLAEKIPKNKIIISESGISSNEYVKKIKNKVNAILVGHHFMNSQNIEESIKTLIK
ncbi:MAG: indole-3-glycerol phosphate synthase TrpC [Nanoarchaeota archaeon]